MENPRRLYYLDDDTDDLHFFREAAESLGHHVEIFVNGTMMLKSLKKETLPDIIFLDIRMPVFDGEQILDILKKDAQCKHISVVLISGAFAKSSVAHYLEAGASYVMKKASNLEDLNASLVYVLGLIGGVLGRILSRNFKLFLKFNANCRKSGILIRNSIVALPCRRIKKL